MVENYKKFIDYPTCPNFLIPPAHETGGTIFFYLFVAITDYELHWAYS